MAWSTRSARRKARPPRNTAPMWKKLAIVLSAPVALILVLNLLHRQPGAISFFQILIAVVVAGFVVWGMSKLLGVHLGLRSWD